ncbi:MAG TPA: SPOR domain-containing protein [Terriglobales bacterium]|nr:SPOR domain-containing protein [Terriglobales bacterium]
MASSQDTEITLGTGKMLALFFGLVVLCAIFFGMGFSLGKSTAKPMMAESTPTTPVSNGARPTAIKPANATSNDTAFYKPAAQKESEAAPESAAQTTPATTEAKPPDPMVPVATSGYFVQVAAVTKQEDAQALVEALKSKQYPAFVAANAGADKLFHVQVGPYADVKDAEAMRAKLVNDGYNPILKK